MGMGQLPDVVNGYKWELYNIAEDYSENKDLAAKMPDKLRNMQELFLVEAAKYNVLPLDNSVLQRALTPRPSPTAGKSVFTYSGEVAGTPEGSAPSTLGKSFSISAEVDIPQGGAEGMLNTIGGRFGGYGLYLVKGKPVFTYVQLTTERFRWESPAALTPGKHTIVFDFKYDGPGFGKGGTGVLSVDGKEVARKTMPHTIPFLISFDESFDVGVDTRTGVDDNDYQVPFRFTGKLDKLTVKLDLPTAAEEKLLQQKAQETKTRPSKSLRVVLFEQAHPLAVIVLTAKGQIDMSDAPTKKEVYSVDTNTMPWKEFYVEQLKAGFPIKELFLDPDTAMGVAKITYRAGFTNRWHYHHCSHGMYVLDGILKTHAGSFGPGSFVWFPEGMEMEHGATQDNDVTFLFITNKPFDIIYTFEEKRRSSTREEARDGPAGFKHALKGSDISRESDHEVHLHHSRISIVGLRSGSHSRFDLRPADHRNAGLTERHDDDRRQVSSASARAVWRNDQSGCQGFQTVLAASRGAAQRCPQRLADHDR